MQTCCTIYGYAHVLTAAPDEIGQVHQLKVVKYENVFREKLSQAQIHG